MKRRMPISGNSSKCKIICMDGRNYLVRKSMRRSSEKELKKKGVIIHLDYDRYYSWLNKLTTKYSGERKLRHPMNVPVSGIIIDLSDEGMIWTELYRESCWPESVYLINCYNYDTDELEMQVMCDVSGSKAKYVRVADDAQRPSLTTSYKSHIEDTSAAVVSVILLGVKVYLNLTKFEVYDEITGTTGKNETYIRPMSAFGKADYLMGK